MTTSKKTDMEEENPQQSDTTPANSPPVSPVQLPHEQPIAVIQPQSQTAQAPQLQSPQVLQPAQPAVSSGYNTDGTSVQPSIYPQPAAAGFDSRMHIDGQPVAHSAPGQQLQRKRRLPWVKITIGSLLVIILATAGTILATNQNVRATVFRQKYMSYAYPICKTHTCSIQFYKGSKIASYAPWTPPGEPPEAAHMSLISPVIDGKTFVAMDIDAFPIAIANTKPGQQFLTPLKDCSGSGLIAGFSDYLPNLGTTANVCGVSDGNGPVLGYVTAFTSQKTGSFFTVTISENFSINSQGHLSPVFNLTDHQGEIESILASLDIKG
ncbi:MAG TPA: hypothetical protein VF261_02055 [Candidatus Saccharimonadales bacterium]